MLVTAGTIALLASCTADAPPCERDASCLEDAGTCARTTPVPLLLDHVGVLRSGEVVGVGREAFTFLARMDPDALTLSEPRTAPIDVHVRDGLLTRIDEEGRLLVAERIDQPWEVRGRVPAHVREIVISEGVWLADGAEPEGLVHRSDDEGRSWITLAGNGLDPRAYTLVGAEGRRVWARSTAPVAGAEHRVLFRSEDEGETFTALDAREIDGASMPLPGVLFVSTPAGECSRSVDGGESWRDSEVRCTALSRFVGDGELLFMASERGMGRSHDRGATFETSDVNPVLAGVVGGRGFFQFRAQVYVWGAEELYWSPTLERSSRLFVREAHASGTVDVFYVHAVRETELGSHSVVLRTDDGGRTFREVSSSPFEHDAPALAVASRDHFAVPGESAWQVTTDGGASFRSLGPHYTQLTAGPTGALWAIEGDAGRFVARSSGDAWARVTPYERTESVELLVVDARDRPLLISITGAATRLELDGTWSHTTPDAPCAVGLTPALDVLTPPDGRVLFRCHRGTEVFLAALDADDARATFTLVPGFRTSSALGDVFERLVLEPSGSIDLVLSHSGSTRIHRLGSESATLLTERPIDAHAAFIDGEDLVLIGDGTGCDSPRVEHVALEDLAGP